MLTIKQRVGVWLIPKLPINSRVFNHVRLELNAVRVRALSQLNPQIRKKTRWLKRQTGLLVNVGCGPFGESEWINLDLFSHSNVTFPYDCRRSLPLANKSCAGIHTEHFFEHLNPQDECADFLAECLRSLQPEGVLRVVVPDAEMYIRAYIEPGWSALNNITCGGEVPEQSFTSKMEALNHVFHQGGEHHSGYDAESMELTLRTAGFSRVKHCTWRVGDFPNGCIDREQHRPYSLYFEAKP